MSPEAPLNLRPARAEDAGLIRAVVRSAYAKWVPIIGREPRPMSVDYEQALQKHDIDLAYSGSKLVALIETVLREDHLWIENLAVTTDEQGKGFGRQLLTHAESKAVNAGCADIRLLTNEAFEANVALYEKVGYKVDTREPFMGGTTVYMSKRLTSEPAAS